MVEISEVIDQDEPTQKADEGLGDSEVGLGSPPEDANQASDDWQELMGKDLVMKVSVVVQ